jgi:hypothetical protein
MAAACHTPIMPQKNENEMKKMKQCVSGRHVFYFGGLKKGSGGCRSFYECLVPKVIHLL